MPVKCSMCGQENLVRHVSLMLDGVESIDPMNSKAALGEF